MTGEPDPQQRSYLGLFVMRLLITSDDMLRLSSINKIIVEHETTRVNFYIDLGSICMVEYMHGRTGGQNENAMNRKRDGNGANVVEMR